MAVAIKNFTQPLPKGPGVVFSDIAESVLPEWDISLVFVSSKKALELNNKLRGKNYVPNGLSYVVGDKSAEIIICPSEARKQAPSFQLPASSFLLLLFIHGALHIKGWAHGGKMEKCERNVLAKVATRSVRKNQNETAHSDRNRHRHIPSKDGGGRGSF